MEREDFVDGIPGTELLVSYDTVNAIETDNSDNELVLIPPPTECGRDPLTWSKPKKYWQLFLVALYAAIFAFGEGDLGAAWTTVSDDIGVDMDNMNGGSALNFLLLGFFNIFWIPTAMKFGRKVVLIATTTIALPAMVWIGKAMGNAQWYLAMTLMGIGVAGYEVMIQLTIFDTFFVHERGRALAVYLLGQQIGSTVGLVTGGVIADNIGWQWTQYIVAIADGILLLLFIFTFEETLFPRFLFERAEHTDYIKEVKSNQIEVINSPDEPLDSVEKAKAIISQLEETQSYEAPSPDKYPARSLLEIVKDCWVYYPEDKTTYWQYFRRPFILFTFPNLLFAGLNFGFSATAGMLSFSIVADIFMDPPYNYDTTTTGVLCIGSLIGSFIGWGCGSTSDYIAIFFAKRNNGIKEPEMRLYAMVFPFAFAALGYMMLGWGAERDDRWPVLSVGMGFMTANLVSQGSIATAYAMDCFRGIGSELVVVLAVFSACINFAVSFSCQQFVDAVGYGWICFTYGMLVMAANALSIPVMYWGKSWRKMCADKYFKFVEEGKQ